MQGITCWFVLCHLLILQICTIWYVDILVMHSRSSFRIFALNNNINLAACWSWDLFRRRRRKINTLFECKRHFSKVDFSMIKVKFSAILIVVISWISPMKEIRPCSRYRGSSECRYNGFFVHLLNCVKWLHSYKNAVRSPFDTRQTATKCDSAVKAIIIYY